MSSDLFVTVSADALTTIPILIIDASGSVKNQFYDAQQVFDKMLEFAQSINAKDFRAIFWNSDKAKLENFPNGAFVIPHIVTKATLSQTFTMIKGLISTNCLTFPHLGFNAIPNEWFSDKDATHVYFITDGQIGYGNINAFELNSLKQQLATSVKTMFKNHNNIHLHIIAVEIKMHDFNNVETVDIMAGGDVFKVFSDNGLTNFITEFTSYAPNNLTGYSHIKRIIPPKGFIAFGSQCFSEMKTNEFIEYLRDLIQKTQGEDQLLKIIQNLATTLKMLTKDKPLVISENIIRNFCALFANTVIDPTIIQFMLADSVRREASGQGQVFGQYRAQLKELFKQANELLAQSTKNALGINSDFMSLPFNNVIVTGSSGHIVEQVRFDGIVFPFSSVYVNGKLIPVLPFLSGMPISTLSEQCIRQFTRQIISKQYGIDKMSDAVIFIVLGLMLQTVCSPVDDTVRNAYRYLATIMLRKMRLNSQTTELARLEAGELPTPNNGKLDEMTRNMAIAQRIINLDVKPMTFWYAVCLALNNHDMIVKQLIHCVADITADFPDIHPQNLLQQFNLSPFMQFVVSETFDYSCIYTGNDCSADGGVRINPHYTATGVQCKPNFVISKEGFDHAQKQPRMYCPYCYKTLTIHDHTEVPPKVVTAGESTVLPDDVPNIFEMARVHIDPVTLPAASAASDTNARTGNLVLLKGVVGAGKSTFAQKLQEKVTALGAICINTGTDKYAKTGMPMKQAIESVKQELKTITTVPHDKMLVVIIDTCGDQDNVKSTSSFDYNFAGWNIIRVFPNYDQSKKDQYFAWTLRNVLLRPMHNATTNYWLNPASAGVKVCVDVHTKKMQLLFGGKNKAVSTKATIPEILADIQANADVYAQFLATSLPIEDKVNEIVKQMK